MMRRAAVHLFAYDEPHLRETLDAYAKAETPDGWMFDYVVGVTPKNGRTVQEVEAHPTFRLMKTPKGKLSSRNVVHDSALEDGAEVIISGDADAPPAQDDYLVKMLEPLTNSGVVGVNGFQQAHGLTRPLLMAGYYGDLYVNRPMFGRSSAFRADAWRAVGPFDTDLDQTDVHEVRQEEEFRFRRSLEDLGDVIDRTDARVTSSGRRVMCMALDALNPVGRSEAPYCSRRGTETFAPDRRR